MRPRTILIALAALILLGGCSTHEAKFDAAVPPPPGASTAPPAKLLATPALLASIGNSSATLTALPDRAVPILPTAALPALTRAAALGFEDTGSPDSLVLTRLYADALLGRLVTIGGQAGLLSERRGPRTISLSTTLRAGLALSDAYRLTNDRRYREAVLRLARTVSGAPFGLQAFDGGYVMRTLDGDRFADVSLTALTAALINEAAATGPGVSRRFADGALRTVARNQAAVGRWYAYLGTPYPMDLEQWGSTLTSLATLPAAVAKSIVATGVPAIQAATFTPAGTVRLNSLTIRHARGIAFTLQAIATGSGDASTASAFEVGGHQLQSFVVAPGADKSTEAELALAFAIFYHQLKLS